MIALLTILLLIGLLMYRYFVEPILWIDTVFIIILILFLLGLVNVTMIEPLQISMEIQNNGLVQTQKSIVKNIRTDGNFNLTAQSVSTIQ
jgi:hypothetical protein